MKVKKKSKLLVSLLAVVLCMAAFSMTAFASGDDWCEWGDYGTPETTATPAPTETPAATATPEPPVTPAPSTTPAPAVTPAPATPAPTDTPESDTPADSTEDAPVLDISDLMNNPDFADLFNALLSGAFSDGGDTLTPPGNLTLIDDILQITGAAGEDEKAEREEKQFIVVQSKNGNYFYIVIDRSGDEENVHFLNQVDEADLLALMEDEKTESKPVTCTCTDKCVVGDINTACPVCQTTMSNCTGKETEPAPTDEPDTEPEQSESKSGSNAILLIVLVLALVGGCAFYFLKFKKKKPDTKGPVDLDDYDFGDDEDSEDEDYAFEPDDDEPEERNEGD